MLNRKEMLLIITISVAIVLIMSIVAFFLFAPTFLFLQSYSKPPLISEDSISASDDVGSSCSQLCNAIKSSSLELRLQSISDYCAKRFAFPKTEYPDIIVKGTGENSFCRDGVRCFLVTEGLCIVDGESINAQVCLESMCVLAKSLGASKEVAEKRIKQLMAASDSFCQPRRGSQIKADQYVQTIQEETWWEKYFEYPDCSKIIAS